MDTDEKHFFEAEQKVNETTSRALERCFTTWWLIISSLQFAFVILATCAQVWTCTLSNILWARAVN